MRPATSSCTSGEGTCLAQCRDAVGELRRRRRASSRRHARCEDDCLLRDGVADHSQASTRNHGQRYAPAPSDRHCAPFGSRRPSGSAVTYSPFGSLKPPLSSADTRVPSGRIKPPAPSPGDALCPTCNGIRGNRRLNCKFGRRWRTSRGYRHSEQHKESRQLHHWPIFRPLRRGLIRARHGHHRRTSRLGISAAWGFEVEARLA